MKQNNRTPIKHSRKFWNKHLESWSGSGLSQSEYCRIHNVSIKAFGHHKISKFGKDKPEKASKSLGLVALPIQYPDVTHEKVSIDSGISINFGNQANIKISNNFNSKCLAEVIKIVSLL